MDFWFFLLAYGGMGALVGAVRARYDFRTDLADPDANLYREVYDGDDHRGVPQTKKVKRTELERAEACAESAARWGWVNGIFWPIVIVSLFFICVTATAKNLAGGKELRAVRRAKAQAEIEAKAAQYAAEAKEAWTKLYGPDAPKDLT